MESGNRRHRERFESLVVDHHVQLRAFVRSLAVDPDWVDDVAQETFLTAYREWKSFDNSRDFGKWLRGIAANIVRNELRKDARRQRILHTELAELLLDRQRDDRSETEPISIDTVRDCLEKLTARNRELVRARYRDGDTAERLAERFELSAANVRQLLARARIQIKQCIELRLPGVAIHE
jgi:RNA polymerase sigma-70 factor, ECF subfamily